MFRVGQVPPPLRGLHKTTKHPKFVGREGQFEVSIKDRKTTTRRRRGGGKKKKIWV